MVSCHRSGYKSLLYFVWAFVFFSCNVCYIWSTEGLFRTSDCSRDQERDQSTWTAALKFVLICHRGFVAKIIQFSTKPLKPSVSRSFLCSLWEEMILLSLSYHFIATPPIDSFPFHCVHQLIHCWWKAAFTAGLHPANLSRKVPSCRTTLTTPLQDTGEDHNTSWAGETSTTFLNSQLFYSCRTLLQHALSFWSTPQPLPPLTPASPMSSQRTVYTPGTLLDLF